MRGSNAQVRANHEQARRYRLSGDLGRVVLLKPSTDLTGGLRVPIWQYLALKYMENERKRGTLGALALMAGYEI